MGVPVTVAGARGYPGGEPLRTFAQGPGHGVPPAALERGEDCQVPDVGRLR